MILRVVREVLGVEEFHRPDRGEELAHAGDVHPRVFRPPLARVGGRLRPVPYADVHERAILAHVEDVSGHVVLELVPDRESHGAEVHGCAPRHFRTPPRHAKVHLALGIDFLRLSLFDVCGREDMRACLCRGGCDGTNASSAAGFTGGLTYGHRSSPGLRVDATGSWQDARDEWRRSTPGTAGGGGSEAVTKKRSRRACFRPSTSALQGRGLSAKRPAASRWMCRGQ